MPFPPPSEGGGQGGRKPFPSRIRTGRRAAPGVGLLLLLTLPAFSAPIARQTFPALPDPATGWSAYALDANDAKSVIRPAQEGGIYLQRGTPWGLPGAAVIYSGDRASSVRTIRSSVEFRTDTQGDVRGRQTWLAGFTAGARQTPALLLTFDIAGTNGADGAGGPGGPGDYRGKGIRSGLKLWSPARLIPDALVSGTEGGPGDLTPFTLLTEATPQIGHLYESLLSYDPATGAIACRVVDRTAETTIWEGNFTIKPTNQKLQPLVGGCNYFAAWASDKGFAMRIAEISLDDAFTPAGPKLSDPRAKESAATANIPQRYPMPTLDMFQAANNPPGLGFQRFGLGWGRHDFGWGAIEPERGKFIWAGTDRLILDAHAAGLEILPMLGYTAGWANAKHEGFAPPDNVADWEDFVARTVARYSRPPFNLKYFQVWNEPTRKAGFWKGKSEEEWVDTIYLPAARIIRKYDCSVVFGGWPISEPERLDAFLTYHDAWRVTDIVDVHYFEMRSWQAIYDKWIRPGKCRGIWQTEIGYLEFPNYYPNAYLRGLYWALTHDWHFADQYKLFWFAFWGAGPDAPRCLTGPDDFVSEHGKRALVLQSLLGAGTLSAFDAYSLDSPLPSPSRDGRGAGTAGGVGPLPSPPLPKPGSDRRSVGLQGEADRGVRTPSPSASSPDLLSPNLLPFTLTEDLPTSMGFLVRPANRIVIAFCVDPATQKAHPTLTLTLARPATGTARLVSVTGETTPLALTADKRTVAVPVAGLASLTARNYGKDIRFAIGYIVIE